MDNKTIQLLEMIHQSTLLIAIAISAWVLIKLLDATIRVITGFKGLHETRFRNRMEELLDLGNYQNVLSECSSRIDKFPNHIYANWYIAKAYFYTDKKALAAQHFEHVLFINPGWEDSVAPYITQLSKHD